ncbi:MAG: crotonase/enoyl-CoA hydratase family protein, partial [Ilumatobacteraceae bacterium]
SMASAADIAARVSVTMHEGIAHVRLTRPDKRNALDDAMFQAIAQAGERVKHDTSVRAVVLSGDGASFCAGLDFGGFQAMGSGNSGDGSATAAGSMKDGRITHLAQQICWVWQEVPVPVIAALQGHALGGGMQLALGADIRIAHPDTKMSMREVHWGLIPDMTGTLRLSRLVRDDVMKDLVFTGRIFPASEGATLGVVTRLSNDPVADAMVAAAEIAGRSPSAVRGAKQLINRLSNAGAAEHFAAEREIIFGLIGKPHQVEAITANFENRAPKFEDVG